MSKNSDVEKYWEFVLGIHPNQPKPPSNQDSNLIIYHKRENRVYTDGEIIQSWPCGCYIQHVDDPTESNNPDLAYLFQCGRDDCLYDIPHIK
jgi:hypothetical protein